MRPRDERSAAKNADDLPSDSERYLKDASQYATVFRDKNNADATVANESRITLLKNRYGNGALGHGYLQYASGRLTPKERTRNTTPRKEEAPDPWT